MVSSNGFICGDSMFPPTFTHAVSAVIVTGS
jgi:hypothetical protein